jgi:large subunit ribosomal protein L7/L12
VMPTYNPPVDRVVSPAVEEIFKDLLKLQQPHDIAVVGHLLMRRLCVSNEQMMMILQARFMGGSGMSSSDASASAEAAAPVVEEKKIFDLKLVGFDDKSKIKVIKEIRAITGLGLKEAKDLVDSAPKVLKKDVKKEEAEQIKDVLTKVGAVVEIV